MNTGFGVVQVSLRFVIESSDHSVSNHLPSPRHESGFCVVGRTGPHCCGRPLGAVRQLGFAFGEQARHDGRPNRVYLRYGLIVHLRLLSTPPRGDAVTFGYRAPDCPGKVFHLADSMQLQAHSPFAPRKSLLSPSEMPFRGEAVIFSTFVRWFSVRRTSDIAAAIGLESIKDHA